MKKLRILAVVLAVVMMAAVVVSAVDSAPSAEVRDVEVAPIQNGVDILFINPENDNRDGYDDAQIFTLNSKMVPAALVTAANEVAAADDLTELAGDFAEAWDAATEGAPVENATIFAAFDVSAVDGTTPDGDVALFKVKIDGLYGQNFAVLHLVSSTGEYETIPGYNDANGSIDVAGDADTFAVAAEDGTLTIQSTGLSPFIVLVDNGNAAAPADTTTESPKTGVNTAAATAVAAVLCIGCGIACTSYAKKH